MATRIKTIEYAFPTDTVSLTALTRKELSGLTIYIPETSSRVFKSVILELCVRGNETASTSITQWMLGIKLGAVAFSDLTSTATLANTADQQSHVFTRDVTQYFQDNFGVGTSQTCAVAMQFGGLVTINHTVKLIITYAWNDTAQDIRVKTVRIPLESNTASLTNVLASIGTNQIPALDTFLPEASKTYRQIWMEFIFNDGGDTATDFWLSVALDAAAETDIYFCEQVLRTGVFGKAIWNLSSMTTNATHDLKARSDNVTSRFSLLGAVLYVTYEYSHNNVLTTTILNSLVLPMAHESAYAGSTTNPDMSRFVRTLWVQETSPTLVQSGVAIYLNNPDTLTLSVRAGVQSSYRAYTLTQGNSQSGPFALTHRVDSGSQHGAMLASLVHGRNTVNFDWFVNANADASNFSAILYLNYTSDKDALGDGAHTTTTCWCLFDNGSNNPNLGVERDITAPARMWEIPTTDWFVVGLMFEILGSNLAAAGTGAVLLAQAGVGEGAGAGWVDVVNALYRSDGDVGTFWTAGAARNQFERWKDDPDSDRLSLLTSRAYRMCTATSMTLNCRVWLTSHPFTYTVTGNVTGSNGGSVTIDIFRVANDEKVGTVNTTGDGTYSFTWYDDTEELYAVAYEDATHVGRSANGTAT